MTMLQLLWQLLVEAKEQAEMLLRLLGLSPLLLLLLLLRLERK